MNKQLRTPHPRPHPRPRNTNNANNPSTSTWTTTKAQQQLKKSTITPHIRIPPLRLSRKTKQIALRGDVNQVFVARLSSKTDKYKLRRIFQERCSQYGVIITEINIKRNYVGKNSSSYAFVTLDSLASALITVSIMNNCNVDGCHIHVDLAHSRRRKTEQHQQQRTTGKGTDCNDGEVVNEVIDKCLKIEEKGQVQGDSGSTGYDQVVNICNLNFQVPVPVHFDDSICRHGRREFDLDMSGMIFNHLDEDEDEDEDEEEDEDANGNGNDNEVVDDEYCDTSNSKVCMHSQAEHDDGDDDDVWMLNKDNDNEIQQENDDMVTMLSNKFGRWITSFRSTLN